MTAKTGDQNDSPRQLGEALKRFCRSVELCDDYLRGYYGLKTVSDSGFIEGTTGTESRQRPPSSFSVKRRKRRRSKRAATVSRCPVLPPCRASMLLQLRNWQRSHAAFQPGRRDGRVTMAPRSQRPANCCKRILAPLRNRQTTQSSDVVERGPWLCRRSVWFPILTQRDMQAEQVVGWLPLSRPRATVATVFWPSHHSQRVPPGGT